MRGKGDGVDLGEGSGMFTLEAPIRELSDLEVKTGTEGVEESALADATMAGKEDCGTSYHLLQHVESRAFQRRHFQNGVTGIDIDGLQLIVNLPQFVIIEVHLVEDNGCGDMIGLGSDQESIDEARGGTGEAEGGHDAEKVDVGGDDMGLLAEFGCATDDVVAAVVDVEDKGSTVVLQGVVNAVAHSHGVSLLVAAQTIVAAQTTIEGAAVRQKQTIPAASGADDQSISHRRECFFCRKPCNPHPA